MPSSPTDQSDTSSPPNRTVLDVRAALIVAGLTLAALLPFLHKAVHVDDYLFIRSARQILEHPFDPYGTAVNWYGVSMPLSDVTQNPPAACYLLAGVIVIGGENESALHAAFLLPAVLAALGIYFLARRLCAAPLAAAVIAVLTPVFWLSATTLMCDVPMLALWVWAVVLWIHGMDQTSNLGFGVSALLITLAALTKYFGVALVPLLLAYTLVRERRPRRYLLWLLLPAAVLWGYERFMTVHYGHGLLAAAGDYASTRVKPGEAWQRGITTLSFTGGCALPLLFLSPMLWSWRRLAGGAVLAGGLVALLAGTETFGILSLRQDGVPRWGAIVQIAVLALAGFGLLIATLEDLWTERTAEALLLALWCGGTLFFTGVLNWTINGRSLLPLAPVAGIVIVRRIQRSRASAGKRWTSYWPILPAALCAAVVVQADAALADQSRAAARIVHERLGESTPIWFQGHWGFQYYMEAAGAHPVDRSNYAVRPGDYLITPAINTNLSAPPAEIFETFGSIEITAPTWVATMNIREGVGFYSDSWGPLPFGIIGPHNQRFEVARMRRPRWGF